MATDGQWPGGFGPDTICFYFTVDVECAAEEVLVDLRTLFDQHGPGGARTGYRRAHAAHLPSHGGERAPLVDGHGGRGQCALAERRKMDVKPASAITVEPLGADEAMWENFLAHAPNGTLFHDLRFLRYHPPDRFRFHHLVFRRNGEPVALLPGGLASNAERPMFSSPLGASIGGLAVNGGLRAELAVNLVEALQNYARAQSWLGVEITLPPRCYCLETSGLIEFALFCRGFRLTRRWLCPMLPLTRGGQNSYERTFRRRQIAYVRTARRKGMVGIEVGVEGLSDFLKVFHGTYERHGVAATHTPEEIRDLLQRLPDRVRINLAMLGEVPVAGLLVFRLSATVANTFYICSSIEHASEHGAAFIIADLIDRLSQTGFRYLDFGPSASDQNFNRGVTFFKEGLGAVGQCRDRWHWEAG